MQSWIGLSSRDPVQVGQQFCCQADRVRRVLCVEASTNVHDLWKCRDITSGRRVLLDTKLLDQMERVV